jgi:hypothetical protein
VPTLSVGNRRGGFQGLAVHRGFAIIAISSLTVTFEWVTNKAYFPKLMINVAIIGAGPYGLSVAAHLRRHGVPFRIFGRTMDSWLAHMPEGMMLKSDGFASNIYDPDGDFTLKHFCAQKGIEYADVGIPVRLDTFSAYGLAFRDRMVPELEDRTVVSLDRASGAFVLRMEDGEKIPAKQVVLAVGITHFEYVPETLSHLPAQFLSHSAKHHDLEQFRGRSVTVIGGGSSALDMAGLLHETGADVNLVARQPELKFHSAPLSAHRSWWKQLRHPSSGLGPGLRSRFYADAPGTFHHLPEPLRLKVVARTLGPSGGWFIRDKVVGKVPLLLGYTPQRADVLNGRVRLQLRASDGAEREVLTQHVIAATGYRVDIERLTFLNPDLRSRLKRVNSTPILSSTFESSVPGLYFVGVSAANSFGPVMRFAFGAGFAARSILRTMMKLQSKDGVSVATEKVAAAAK